MGSEHASATSLIHVEQLSSCATRSQIRIGKEKMEAAKSALHKLSFLEDQSADIAHIVAKLTLAQGVSLQQFQRWRDNKGEKVDGIKVALLNGNVIARELASAPHSAAAACVQEFFAVQNNRQDLVLTFPEHDVEANGSLVSSDVLIKVNNGVGGGRRALSLATAVVEVGVSETVPQLHDRLSFYMSAATIQMYVALKRFGAGGMICMVFIRGQAHPTSVISFGRIALHHSVIHYLERENWMGVCSGQEFGNAPPCTAPNLPDYILQFPAATLFIGRPGGIPAGALQVYTVDLFEVQEAFFSTT